MIIALGFHQINTFAGAYIWLDTLGIFFAVYFEYILLFCLLAALFIPTRFSLQNLIRRIKINYRIFLLAVISSVISRFIITEAIRYVFPVSRPFVDNDVNLLIHNIASPSFPSGHSAFYFALSFAIFYFRKDIGAVCLIASFLICVARVFCGIHWPVDILAGFVVGAFSAWLVIAISRKFNMRKV